MPMPPKSSLLPSPSSPALTTPPSKRRDNASRLPTLSAASVNSPPPASNDPIAAQLAQIKQRRSQLLGSPEDRPQQQVPALRPLESPGRFGHSRSKSLASVDSARFGEVSIAELEPFLRAKSVFISVVCIYRLTISRRAVLGFKLEDTKLPTHSIPAPLTSIPQYDDLQQGLSCVRVIEIIEGSPAYVGFLCRSPLTHSLSVIDIACR